MSQPRQHGSQKRIAMLVELSATIVRGRGKDSLALECAVDVAIRIEIRYPTRSIYPSVPDRHPYVKRARGEYN